MCAAAVALVAPLSLGRIHGDFPALSSQVAVGVAGVPGAALLNPLAIGRSLSHAPSRKG